VVHVHIKDYNGTMLTPDNRRQYLHPGEGDIDFPAFFKRLRERGFEGNISLEASVVGVDGSVGIEKLENSLTKVRELANSKE
jgi:sugar phosphate isomerase/epimerase